MESSKIHGGAEECSSSESGWTTYIASSIHENYDDSNSSSSSSSERKGYKNYHNEYGEDGQSDDSMASDASSGPSHQGHPRQSLVRSHGVGDLKNAQGKDNRKDLSKEHSKKAEKMKSTNEEPGYKCKSLTGNAFSGGKTRRNK